MPAFNRVQRLRCAAAMRARPVVDRVLRLPAARCPKLVESIDSAFSAASMRARSCRRWRIIPCSAFMRRIVAATTVGRAKHICVRLRRSRESRNSGRNRGCGMQFPLTPRWSGYGTARCARRPRVRASLHPALIPLARVAVNQVRAVLRTLLGGNLDGKGHGQRVAVVVRGFPGALRSSLCSSCMEPWSDGSGFLPRLFIDLPSHPAYHTSTP